ncbi:3-deoxy-manno-octulosonate cytidylyltransferase [Candidatus Pelagibacter sp. HIMB1321]|uniref:3-deoxy-manno-octulosonate cytidylyltransferase n=1 Tax=Candidatus Pelagibacter sp. HIMB1321 TaxID=1388755 RepID=UPI000A07E4AB|nr:3-deoxy-manno-octulosonate cytidylyltransferase [Candidatus Pelagibacter sp. HIMB1321]SMF79542.1 3-deoxy-manno-octulosonate cytidylyltransferase (CMP-KDO synthetase) [Candidatus Pelagibacter sp. HIMB1321]
MKFCIVIPARYGSRRYTGKPLVKILGREMILRVADICKKVVKKDDLFIATDDKRISKKVSENGYKFIMTSKKCLTGTDRVAEASKKIKSDIFINVQGDEPTINPKDIKKIIKAKIKFPNHVICGYDRIHKLQNPFNVNLPKVVINEKSELIYISRLAIPGSKKKNLKIKYFKQVCIYAFNKIELKTFYSKGKKGELEKIEDIEILRFFEHNIKIKMIKLNSASVAVDEKSDIKKAEKIIKSKKYRI